MAGGIKLVLGLGNPGPEYAKTRHNAGFCFLDALAEQLGARFLSETKLHAHVAKAEPDGVRLLLAKPTTFMNRSGLASHALLNFYKIEPQDLLVVHDELDLEAGVVRLKFDGGHGGQNGLRDISGQLGHSKYHRLRIGIGHPGHKDQVTPWVLGKPTAEQTRAMRSGIDAALDVLPRLVAGKISEAMKILHTPTSQTIARR
jgi:peptidyl-tRNA hydrolase, PTH1 family